MKLKALHVTCMPSALGSALQVVSRAISTRSTLPILSNILLETSGEGLALTATNLEVGICKVVPTQVNDEGSTTVPARLLTEFVASLPEQELELSLDAETQTLRLRCARFDTHIKCIEAEEFPPGPRPEDGDRIKVGLEEILAAVEQTVIAASTDEARPVLTGILFRILGRELTLAATDGHRLAVRTLSALQADDLDASVIVPSRTLGELVRVFKGAGKEMEIILAKARNQIFFQAGSSEVNSRLIDGGFPNYEQVMPKKSSTLVTASTAELAQTLRAVSLFARDNANVIRLRVAGSELILSATTNEVGDSKAEIGAQVEGEEVQIAFNAKYLLDALSVIGTEQVQLRLDGPLSPGLVRPPSGDHYTYLIMPIRVAM